MKNQNSISADQIVETSSIVLPVEKKGKKEKISKSEETTQSALTEKIKEENPISSERVSKSIYIYPIEIKGKIEKEKQFRSARRTQLKKFVDTYSYQMRIKKGKDETFNKENHFELFLSFYKSFYSTNDFSVGSLRETIKEEEKEEIEFLLKDVQAYISK